MYLTKINKVYRGGRAIRINVFTRSELTTINLTRVTIKFKFIQNLYIHKYTKLIYTLNIWNWQSMFFLLPLVSAIYLFLDYCPPRVFLLLSTITLFFSVSLFIRYNFTSFKGLSRQHYPKRRISRLSHFVFFKFSTSSFHFHFLSQLNFFRRVSFAVFYSQRSSMFYS